MNSLPPSMLGGQDMMSSGPSFGSDEARLFAQKKAELNEIMEQQRKLYSNLDNLDRQRSQILGEFDKSAALNYHLQGQPGGGRFPPLRSGLSQNPFSPSSMGHQMRSPSGNIGAARDVLNGFNSSTMNFLNRKGDVPPSLMDSDFGNMPNGFPAKAPTGGTLGSLRGRYDALEGSVNSGDPAHVDKRRRFLDSASSFPNVQKPQLGRLSDKNFHENLRSSSFLPSEIMVTPKSTSDSLSVLSSSHQLLMRQREANMQREAQNMLFYQGMNTGGRSPMGPGLNRMQPQHDGKLPETKRKLSKDFVPEVDTVVLGKGNIPKTNLGNLKLKGIVMDNLVEYANGERRKKIAVISRIISHVTAANYKTTGFVKFEDDCWYEMTERDARVKITALFRDCLHDQYRSSSSSKVKRRQELRKSRSLAAAASAKASSETTDKEETSKKECSKDETGVKKEADASASKTDGGEKPAEDTTKS